MMNEKAIEQRIRDERVKLRAEALSLMLSLKTLAEQATDPNHDVPINDLGEIQGRAVTIDCRCARIATLERVLGRSSF